ncbi:hypothetical protein HDU82_004707 [Entophlyctis luteolus]|nr:hypothetical protein HDU82_004707 [Entophlyctis luteolus]
MHAPRNLLQARDGTPNQRDDQNQPLPNLLAARAGGENLLGPAEPADDVSKRDDTAGLPNLLSGRSAGADGGAPGKNLLARDDGAGLGDRNLLARDEDSVERPRRRRSLCGSAIGSLEL